MAYCESEQLNHFYMGSNHTVLEALNPLEMLLQMADSVICEK
jgi:hypothetical protein